MSKVKTYKLGDVVPWSSQSKGHTTTKKGEVVAIVRPGSNSVACANRIMRKTDRLTFADGERDHQSYIIRVGPTGSGKISKLYWPRVKYLGKARR